MKTTVERCLGQCRWVPLSGLQAHRKKLQQLWEITEYETHIEVTKPVAMTQEWRDVPDEATIP
jgi:hypothetical protein